jgi:hypothetical protein
MPTDERPDLDAWLPDPQVRAVHRGLAHAEPGQLWSAAASVHVADARILGRAVRWRIPGTPPGRSFRELLRCYPFAVLDEGETWSLSGLCGRLWTLRRDYPRIESPDQFRRWDEPGTVRVLIGHWVEADANAGASDRVALVSESRVKPVDRRAALRLRGLWALLGGLERRIGGEVLPIATRRAEGATN